MQMQKLTKRDKLVYHVYSLPPTMFHNFSRISCSTIIIVLVAVMITVIIINQNTAIIGLP